MVINNQKKSLSVIFVVGVKFKMIEIFLLLAWACVCVIWIFTFNFENFFDNNKKKRSIRYQWLMLTAAAADNNG